MTSRQIPGWISGAVVMGGFVLLVWAEHRRPLREKIEAPLRHNLRNLAVAGMSGATLQVLEKPVVGPLARVVEEWRWGLLQRANLPKWLEVSLGVLLMDYTLYLWHILTHRVPFLWRFHAVHHVDLDMTASTALRFHFAEMAISVPDRAAQVVLIGVGPRALSIWQTFTILEIMFHHSNLRLPHWLERRLVRVVVTPRMHGIHHSIVPEETGSNWSSGLTIWDWLHGALRLNVPQREIEIGIPAYRDPAEVRLPRLVEMPFTRQRPSFRLPDGSEPPHPPRPDRNAFLPPTRG